MEYLVRTGETETTVRILRDEGERVEVQVGDRTLSCQIHTLPDGRIALTDDQRHVFRTVTTKDALLLVQGPVQRRFEVEDARSRWLAKAGGKTGAAGGRITASMPGRVVQVPVQVGDVVQPGGVVAVLEAMKMENDVRAPGGGKVVAVAVKEGQAVELGAPLVQLEPLP